ncbi:MAG: hypothetical protein M3R24_33105 [Chloroflexota bacterium]|nr:hypothetical protein [Chloroflexota bacterium]
MSDQVIAAMITGIAAIIAAGIGLLRWREHAQRFNGRALASGLEPPIFDAARMFARFSTLAEKKTAIQPIEVALSHGSVSLTNRQMEYCAASEWELDRIGLYLFEEYTAQPHHAVRMLHVRHEYERLRVATFPRSSLPLLYATRSLVTLLKQQRQLAFDLHEHADLFHEINQFLRKHPQIDADAELVRLVDKLSLIVQQA